MPEAPLPHTSLDKGLKAYFRVLKTVPLRLLGLNPDPAHVRSDETTAIVRQLEADRYFLYEPPGQAPEALLLEIFLDPPKEEQFLDCLLKALQLARDRKLPVVLVFLYLRQGRYATFPDELVMEGFAGLRNLYQVEVRRLWEYEEEIRTGALGALAPLLLLWETNPEETGFEVIREEVRIVEGAGLTAEERREALALTFIVGRRAFSSDVLRAIMGERMSEIKESGIIQEWLEEVRAEALVTGRVEGRVEGRVQGRAEGRAEGRVEGQVEGRLGKAHELLLKQGERRFGKPTRRIRTALGKIAEEARLDALALRLLEVETWDELLELK